MEDELDIIPDDSDLTADYESDLILDPDIQLFDTALFSEQQDTLLSIDQSLQELNNTVRTMNLLVIAILLFVIFRRS